MTSLADDERTLAQVSSELSLAIDAAIERWVPRILLERCAVGGVAAPPQELLSECVDATRAEVGPAVRSALAVDVDSGGRSALDAVRAGVGPMNELLETLGAAAPPRDEFAQRAFPADRYGLGPASFADIDASLEDPGVAWGAARAHVHLRRRREQADG